MRKKLADKGWLTLAWPEEYGGAGASHMMQVIFAEEMAYHRAHASLQLRRPGDSGIAEIRRRAGNRLADRAASCRLGNRFERRSDMASSSKDGL